MSYQALPTIQPIKRGDSFLMTCIYKEDSTATSLVGYTIRSQVRSPDDTLIEELDVTILDQVTNIGQFVLSAGTIENWPIDLLRCDIEFSEGATVRSTQTFLIPVVGDITRD